MNELIKVDYTGEKPAVSARELHEFLEVGTKYADWFPRMCEYGFTEGQDFNLLKNEQVRQEGNRMVSRLVDDAAVSIDMAKEICMLQRNEKGKLARQYFLRLERDWNSPEKVMARALRYAQQELQQVKALNSELIVDNQIMKPKAEYFDELVERNLLTNFGKPPSRWESRPSGLWTSCWKRSMYTAISAASFSPVRTRTTGFLRSRSVLTKRPSGAAPKRW